MSVEELVLTHEATAIIIAILTGIYAAVLSPLCVYYSYKLWKLNEEKIPFFTKRHAKLVICNVFTFNIYVLIIRTALDYSKLYDRSTDYNAIRSFFFQLVQICVVFICVRLWLLYYDYTSAVQVMDTKWKAEIVQNVDVYIAWTAKHKWSGNPVITLLIGFVFAAIAISVIVFLPQYSSITQTLPVLYIIFIIIMMIKIHKCKDQFYIRKEFICFMFWTVSCFIMYVFIFLFVPSLTTIRLVVMNFYVSVAAYSICFLSTWWIMRQHKKSKEAVVKSRIGKRLDLSDILKHQDRFDLFANHLVTEFAIENLAFVLEIMQIKHEMIANKLLTDDNVGYIIEIPLGTIKKVRRKNSRIYTLQQLKENINYIMEEYITSDAQHCINIASQTRKQILATFRELKQEKVNDDVEDLVERNLHFLTGTNTVTEDDKELTIKYATLMDQSLSEISALMACDSLGRFLDIHHENITHDKK